MTAGESVVVVESINVHPGTDTSTYIVRVQFLIPNQKDKKKNLYKFMQNAVWLLDNSKKVNDDQETYRIKIYQTHDARMSTCAILVGQ